MPSDNDDKLGELLAAELAKHAPPEPTIVTIEPGATPGTINAKISIPGSAFRIICAACDSDEGPFVLIATEDGTYYICRPCAALDDDGAEFTVRVAPPDEDK